jgi:hypothetical protein
MTGLTFTHVPLDDGDRIAGYLVVRAYEARDATGRVVVVDRGPQYAMRYVVAFHPHHARGWVDGVLHDELEDALDTFAVRANHYSAHRGCQCHAS